MFIFSKFGQQSYLITVIIQQNKQPHCKLQFNMDIFDILPFNSLTRSFLSTNMLNLPHQPPFIPRTACLAPHFCLKFATLASSVSSPIALLKSMLHRWIIWRDMEWRTGVKKNPFQNISFSLFLGTSALFEPCSFLIPEQIITRHDFLLHCKLFVVHIPASSTLYCSAPCICSFIQLFITLV